MDEKEIRIKSLEFAFQYLDYYEKENGRSSTYKSENGIVAFAQRFEQYINEGK